MPARSRTLLVRLIAVLALVPAAVPAVAAAKVRSAVLRDGVDPTLTYDLKRVTATLDRTTGRLTVRVTLWRPFATALDGSYWAAGIAVSVAGEPELGGCTGGGSDTVGATRVFLEPEREAPTSELPEIHAASARVSYRLETAPAALRFSADRLVAVVTVEDELLRGADLRCMSAGSAGRAIYDPRQPGGGPSIEAPLDGYFTGFSPRARLRRALRRCEVRFADREEATCKARARARFAQRL